MFAFSAIRTIMRPLPNASRMRTTPRFFSTASPPQERSTAGRYVGTFLLGLTAGVVYTGCCMDNDFEFHDNVEERFPGSIGLVQNITDTYYNSINGEVSAENETNWNESNETREKYIEEMIAKMGDSTAEEELEEFTSKILEKFWVIAANYMSINQELSVESETTLNEANDNDTHEYLDKMLAKMFVSIPEEELEEFMTKIVANTLAIADSRGGLTDVGIITDAFYEVVQDTLGLTPNGSVKPLNIPVITAFVNALKEVWNGWGGGGPKSKTIPNSTTSTSGRLGKDIDGEQSTTNAQSDTDESMKEFSNAPETEVKSEAKSSETKSNDKEKTEWLLYDPEVYYK